MQDYKAQGQKIRDDAKNHVLQYMKESNRCRPKDGVGMKQSDIFKECGFNWGEQTSASETSQQSWIVALLRQLESEDEVERLHSKQWRLRSK